MSFYRIYRPQIIEEIDNIRVREALLRLLAKPKKDLPHAFLFSGSRGTGKTTAARLVAKMFNCTKPVKSGPCGICEQCVSIASGKNLDVLEIDAASNRGIDEIRTLRDGINLSPVSAVYKVYIIDEVHMLTTEAFNALLKTLEEPPPHAVFVLATTDPQKVPVTIKSRCVSVVFAQATKEELIHALKRIVMAEKMVINDEALTLIAGMVEGSFRDGVKFLEQVSFQKGKITEDIVRSVLAVTEEKTRAMFLAHLASRNMKEAMNLIGQLVSEGIDIKTFLVACLEDLEELLIQTVHGKPSDVWTLKELNEVIAKLSTAYAEMKGTAIAQLPLELAVVEYCQLPGEIKKIIPEPVKTDIAVRVIPQEAGSITVEQLANHWADVIAELKPYNHSVAGVMRSTRPKSVVNGIVTIEAFYTFHRDKLSEAKTKEVLVTVFKKLFGEKVKVEVVLGKK